LILVEEALQGAVVVWYLRDGKIQEFNATSA